MKLISAKPVAATAAIISQIIPPLVTLAAAREYEASHPTASVMLLGVTHCERCGFSYYYCELHNYCA